MARVSVLSVHVDIATATPRRLREALACAAASLTLAACARTDDIHETQEASGKPCIDCHRSAYTLAASPLHTGEFPETCETCHNTVEWRPAALSDHHWFPLEGKHASAACRDCHVGSPPTYAGTPETCVGCHRAAYEATTNPAHVSVLPDTCGDCHETTGWVPARVIEHPWFPLDGKHADTPCESCHKGSPKRFLGTPSDCGECHLADYQRSTFPGHDQFPKTCADCHDPEGW